MREIRLYGSEGGGAERLFLPLSIIPRSALVRRRSAILVFSLALFKSEFKQPEARRRLTFPDNWLEPLSGNFQLRNPGLMRRFIRVQEA